MLKTAETLGAVHTHTHTGNFIKEKLYIKYKEIKVDMLKKHGEKTCLFKHINFYA